MIYPDFDAIKNFFELNLWTAEMVGKAAELKVITAEQYKTIIGEDYATPASSTEN